MNDADPPRWLTLVEGGVAITVDLPGEGEGGGRLTMTADKAAIECPKESILMDADERTATINGDVGIELEGHVFLEYLPAERVGGGDIFPKRPTHVSAQRLRIDLQKHRIVAEKANFMGGVSRLVAERVELDYLAGTIQAEGATSWEQKAPAPLDLLDKPVDFQVEKLPLIFALDALERHHGVNVTIALGELLAKGISPHQPVSIKAVRMPLREVFRRVLEQVGLDFEVTPEGVRIPASRPVDKAPPADDQSNISGAILEGIGVNSAAGIVGRVTLTPSNRDGAPPR